MAPFFQKEDGSAQKSNQKDSNVHAVDAAKFILVGCGMRLVLLMEIAGFLGCHSSDEDDFVIK